MAKTVRTNTDNLVTMPVAEPLTAASTAFESIESAIARRAFELYSARGFADGHDLDDWLDAEREVRGETASTAA